MTLRLTRKEVTSQLAYGVTLGSSAYTNKGVKKMYLIKNGSRVYVKKEINNSKGMQMIKDLREEGIKFDRKKNEKKEEGSIFRTRKKIKTILENNIDEKSWFITLTFAENIKDYEKANNYFNLYVKRNFKDLKYICCRELQERGAIHFHLLVFDYQSTIKQVMDDFSAWKHGYIFTKKITFNNPTAISKYFSGYMGKENQLIDKNKKIFTTSRNLKKGQRYNHMIFDYVIKKYGYDVDFNKVDYEAIDLVDLATVLFNCNIIVDNELKMI